MKTTGRPTRRHSAEVGSVGRVNSTSKGILWAATAALGLSWLPLFYLYTHVSDDPFVWRSWSFVFQAAGLAPVLWVVPTSNRDWRAKARKLLFYWGEGGAPVRVQRPVEILRTPALWMAVGFAVDLAFWVWAATLIDPLVVTIIFQLAFIGIVWMAARLGRKMAAGDQASPHVMGRKYWVLMVLAFVGAALVIWSETAEVGTLHWVGIVVALVGTATGVGSLWGTISLGRMMGWPGDDPNDLVWNSTYAAVVARVIAMPLTLLGSALFFPPTDNHFTLDWTTVGFLSLIGLFNMIGSLSYRYSMYVTSALAVQRIMFFTPVLQMLWIWLFADVSIANPGALLIGAGIVLLSNLGWQADDG